MPPKPSASATSADGRTVVEVHLTAPPSHTVHDHRRVTAQGFFRRGVKERSVFCGQDHGLLMPDQWDHHEKEIFGRLPIAKKIEKARAYQRNGLLQSMGQVKIGYHHHGFHLVPSFEFRVSSSEPETLNPGTRNPKQSAFETWWRRVEGPVRAMAREAWKHWNDVDNLVATWFDDAPGRVFLIPAEKCEYADVGGVPRLRVNLGWDVYKEGAWDGNNRRGEKGEGRGGGGGGAKAKQFKVKDRYKQGVVELDAAHGEHFLVLKRAADGSGGFAEPLIDGLLRTLEQDDSMQAGDNVSAFLLRTVVRQFKIGHEIKTGQWAGADHHFYDDKLHGPAIKALYQGKVGLINHAANFDHEITFPTPDTKRFEAAKYESVWQRIAQWCGPVGLMFLQGQHAGPLLEMAKEVALIERHEFMGPFLNHVINAAFKPPVPVRVAWNSRCFMEARVRTEMVKWLHSIGALSEGTALDEMDFNQEEEWRRKDVEHGQPKHRTTPLYDAAHGPPDAGGRPAGTKDAGKREGG